MKKIEINNCDIRWIEDELIGLRSCPICKYNYENFLLISIYDDDPHKCENCNNEFVFAQEITVYKLEKE